MNIDLSDMTSNKIYHLMTQTIIPRPIAWVLSKNSSQNLGAATRNTTFNLAPFSYFNAICSNPPLCILSMGKKPDGHKKDTATNLHVGANCVVHIAHVEQATAVTNTAATLDYGKSEVELNDIQMLSHEGWPLPRIADCPIAFLCKVHSTQEIGATPQLIVFVEVLEVYVDDKAVSIKNDRILIDALQINPLARLGANQYASLGDVFNANRPK